MRTILMLTAASLALAACNQPAETAEAAPTAPAATQAEQTPEAYVRGVYAGGYDVEPGQGLWSARTDALVAETRRLTEPGEIGFFEADPICDCQDGTPVLRSVAVTSTGPDSADVSVVQGFSDVADTVHNKTYNLVREGGAWKIDDMHYADMSSEFPYSPFRDQLEGWIADVSADAGQ
jgi:hypothetical protein